MTTLLHYLRPDWRRVLAAIALLALLAAGRAQAYVFVDDANSSGG